MLRYGKYYRYIIFDKHKQNVDYFQVQEDPAASRFTSSDYPQSTINYNDGIDAWPVGVTFEYGRCTYRWCGLANRFQNGI